MSNTPQTCKMIYIKNSIQKVEPFSSSGTVTRVRAISKCHVAEYSTDNQPYQVCLDDAIPDSIKKENDFMMSCPDRICAECGNDHSFRGNFEGVITSIDLIPELLFGKKERLKEVLN
jgi:hypothetical protein